MKVILRQAQDAKFRMHGELVEPLREVKGGEGKVWSQEQRVSLLTLNS